MKLEQLRYFITLAKHQHLGRAAVEAAISPSAISHSVQNLEDEFGCPLFVKHGRNLQLTEDGKRFVELAHSLLQQASLVQQEMKGQQEELSGHYRLAATHGFCENWLTPIWMELAANHPRLTAMISSVSSNEVVEKVIAGEVDFGLCLCPHDRPEVHSKLICNDYLALCVRNGHPILQAHDFSFKLLQDYPVAVSKATVNIGNCETHPLFELFDQEPQTTLYYNSYHTIARALSLSNSWALIPETVALWYSSTLTVIKVPDSMMKIDIMAVWPRQNKHCKVSQLLSDLLTHKNSLA